MRHVIRTAAAVALIALAVPAAAVASGGGNCNASACKVYHEPDGPSAGGHQQQPPQPTTGPNTAGGGTDTQAPKDLSRVLAQAGADKAPLSRLLNDSGGSLQAGSVGSPSLFGAILDMGAGPLALLAILLATALGLAARGPARDWLRARRSSS
jgi:hypothetical protein